MRIAVLGAAGQLGSDIVRAATARNVEVIALTRADADIRDARATEALLAARSFDVLVNCTAYHRTDDAEDNGTLAMQVNADAVRALARHCAARDARFVHVSTDYVFGGDRTRTTPYRESDPVAPLNVYGASKALGETLALGVAGHVTILRVASLFGRGGATAKGGNFVETMLRLAATRSELRVVADQTMSPTATHDVARAMLDLLAREAPPGLYHLVNDGSASWHEFATAIVRGAGLDTPVRAIGSQEFGARAERPLYSVLDASKVQAFVSPLRHWRQALADYLAARGQGGGA